MPIELAEDKNGKEVKTPKKVFKTKGTVIVLHSIHDIHTCNSNTCTVARNHRTHRRRKRCKTLETTLE